jgi:hypothetical protein
MGNHPLVGWWLSALPVLNKTDRDRESHKLPKGGLMSISYGLAEEAWENWLSHQPGRVLKRVYEAYGLLKTGEPDWLRDALHQPFRGATSLADAAAYVWFSGEIAAGKIFLCLKPVTRWASADRHASSNSAALNSALMKVSVISGTQGYDGYATPLQPAPMRRLYLDGNTTPISPEVEFGIADSFPLEVGHCSMSKCVKILEWEGLLARFPYEIRMDGLHPRLFLLAVHPDEQKSRLQLRAQLLLPT